MIGQKLGSFQIESELGSGAMGVVYKATHVVNGRVAAVKVVPAEGLAKGNTAERFEREAEILQQLKHPNIVRFFAVGRSRGTRYFAMEYIEGETLEDRLEGRGFLPWGEVVALGSQLCDALQYAHEKGVVHRDLKPSNIMLTADDLVKLTDFGIAKDLDATALTATGRTLGTAAYMAPEQIRGTPEVSHKTDLYAFGCLLYHMLTGQIPFRGSQITVLMNCHLNEPPPRPSAKNPEVPRALDDLVLKLMAKSPTDRPWDAQLVQQTFDEIADKIKGGETIRMVFGPSGAGAAGVSAPANPTRIGPSSPASEAQDKTAIGARKRKRKSKSKRSADAGGSRLGSWLGTLGVVAVLGALVTVLYLGLRPSSAEELYAKAKPLMESDDVVAWQDADRRFLRELDSRYPDHPYKAEVRDLRDKIELQRAEAVSRRLVGPLAKVPTEEVEGYYLRASKLAAAAESAGDDPYRAQVWTNLADILRSQFPDERGWWLLAEKRAAEVLGMMERRKRAATELIGEAVAANAGGRTEVAAEIWGRIDREYGKYPELAAFLAARRPASVPPRTSPEPAVPGSEEQADHAGDDSP